MGRFFRGIGIVIVAVLTAWPAAPASQSRASSLFAFTTNDFWLNLHRYLYVLGRVRNRAPDASQVAVASAPDDERQGLVSLNDEEHRIWDASVTAYANGLSKRPSVFQPPLSTMTIALANTGDAIGFPLTSFDAAARDALTAAAPVYRKTWWPRHRIMNEQYVARLQQQIEGDGSAIVDALSRIYQLPWPERPYPTHVVAYANWQGAFSFTGERIVLSSNGNSMNDRWYPLESVFHEAMHQWDDSVGEALRAQATRQGVTVAQDLSHALVFFTVGYLVQRLHSEHRPMMDAANIWRGTLSGGRAPVERLRSAIQQTWQPYVDGRGTRDEAFAAMVAAAYLP
jgi:hypothetical protein